MKVSAKIKLKSATLAQREISRRAVLEDRIERPIKHIGGVDVSFRGGIMIGSAVVLSFPDLRLVEAKCGKLEVRVPYIPTFLAFREVPVMIRAIRALKIKPDVTIVDANGILHPRKAGEATHLGVVLDMPTIGVAKSLLCGKAIGCGMIRKVVLRDEIVGYEVRTDGKPIYVSPGHRVSLESALKIVLSTIRGHRLPEPIRQAHMAASREVNMEPNDELLRS